MPKQKQSEDKKEKKFSKAQILSSKKYINERDVLSALLKDDMTYSISEVNSYIKNFRERVVQ